MQNEQQLLKSFFSENDSSDNIEPLIRQYEDNLFNLCCRLAKSRQDAEDLYQQTWLRVIQKSHLFTQISLKKLAVYGMHQYLSGQLPQK